MMGEISFFKNQRLGILKIGVGITVTDISL